MCFFYLAAFFVDMHGNKRRVAQSLIGGWDHYYMWLFDSCLRKGEPPPMCILCAIIVITVKILLKYICAKYLSETNTFTHFTYMG